MDAETGDPNCSDENQQIDAFIDGLGEPYIDNEALGDVRVEEIKAAYLEPLSQRLADGLIDVLYCLADMQNSIDKNAEQPEIREWKRCCCGIADYLFRPRLLSNKDRGIAAGCVVRLSAYVHTAMPLYLPFQPQAVRLSKSLWAMDIPNLRLGGDIEIDPEAPDPISIWQLVAGPDAKERSDKEKLYAASRLINYLAVNRSFGCEVDEADYNDVRSRHGIFNLFDVGSESVAIIAKKVRITQAFAQKLLDGDFNPNRTYYPGAAGRMEWFENLTVVRPPLKFAGAFIRLRQKEESARRALEEIAKGQNRPYLINCIHNNWLVDHQGYIKATLACRLLGYAYSIKALQEWFDEMLKSDSHDVSFAALNERVGRKNQKALAEDTENSEATLKALLPMLAD